MEIGHNTWMIPTQYSDFSGRKLNLFLIRGELLLLIDTGLAGMPREVILPYMIDHGLAPKELSLVANTHAHADHMGGNAEIRAMIPSIHIGAHELERPWIERHESLCAELYERFPCMNLFGPKSRKLMLDICGQNDVVDIVWRGGEEIDLGGRCIEVIHAPGHAPGSIIFLDRLQGILLGGESILGCATGEYSEMQVPYYYDMAIYVATLRHLMELPWDLLLSSHSEPQDREAGLQAIRESIEFAYEFDRQVAASLASRQQPLSFAGILERMRWDYGYLIDLGLALLVETHLHYLVRTRRATKVPDKRWTAI